MKYQVINWLSSVRVNVFITITFKKCLATYDPRGQYILYKMEKSDVEKTSRFLRDRFIKSFHGTPAFRSKSIPFLVFSEKNKDEREHVHILTYKPTKIDKEIFKNKLISIANKNDWVYQQINIQHLKQSPNDIRNLVSYGLKTGFEAFMPNASFVPQ
jgi:hypothetical protein